MFERFTELAKRAVALAQNEAIDLGCDFIGTAHMLIGLVGAEGGVARTVLTRHGVTPELARTEAIRQLEAAGVTRDGGAAAKAALATIGIDVDEIKRRADDTFGAGKFRFPRPPFTPRAKRTLELSLAEAIRLGQSHRIDTEHLLLGLLADSDGVAVKILATLRVDPDELRTEVTGFRAS